ncbi:MAG: hypothetical protein IK109_02620 [Clostridiales bacterium]|nr:hypothetical protein [Clostridiales bacterium]
MNRFSIVKKIRKENRLIHIFGALACLVIVLLFIFALLPKTHKYLCATKNVFSTSCDSYKEDQYYRAKTLFLYDYFAENSDGRFYFAPVENDDGEERYLFVYMPNKYEDKAIDIIEQTYEYIETGDEDVLTESISCNGYMTSVDPKTTKFFNEYLDYAGAPQSEKKKACDTMFVMVPMKDVLLGETILWLILEVFLLGAAIYLLATMFSKKHLKNINAKLAAENMTLEDFDNEFASPVLNVGNVYVSDKHIVTASANPSFVKIEDIVWMFPNTSYSSNGAATHTADFYTKDRLFFRFNTKSKEQSELLCRAVKEKQPNALSGYVIENKDMYFNRFNELIDQVYNRTQEAAAPETAPETVPETIPNEIPNEVPNEIPNTVSQGLPQIPLQLSSSDDVNDLNTPNNNELQ